MIHGTKNLWRTSEFARLTKVTVRALHHYDRLGLLKPQRRTAKGFRLYGENEFARLQQILTLKFIGFSLAQIKKILGNKNFVLSETLSLQRQIIETQRQRLDSVLAAIDRAERILDGNKTIDWDSFQKIIEVIDMEQNTDWASKYYSPEAQTKVEERKKLWTPELQERVTRDWNELTADIEAAIKDGTLPEDERAQALAARWRELVRGFTGGDPEIQAGLNKMYADEANWQTAWKKPFSDEVQNFIYAAMKI